MQTLDVDLAFDIVNGQLQWYYIHFPETRFITASTKQVYFKSDDIFAQTFQTYPTTDTITANI